MKQEDQVQNFPTNISRMCLPFYGNGNRNADLTLPSFHSAPLRPDAVQDCSESSEVIALAGDYLAVFRSWFWANPFLHD